MPGNKIMRRLLYLLIIFSLLVALGLTNPSPSHHREVVATTYNQRNPVTGGLGAGSLISHFLGYRDYLFFSTSTLAGQRVSIGGAGMVVAFPPEYEEVQKILLDRLDRASERWLKELPDTLMQNLPEELHPQHR
jgi:hypothetical protein